MLFYTDVKLFSMVYLTLRVQQVTVLGVHLETQGPTVNITGNQYFKTLFVRKTESSDWWRESF